MCFVITVVTTIENMGINEQQQKQSQSYPICITTTTTTTTTTDTRKMEINKQQQELKQQPEKTSEKSPINEHTTLGVLEQSKKILCIIIVN